MARTAKRPPTLAQVIEAALPRRADGRRPLKCDRAVLVTALITETERWQKLAPQVEPHAEKIRRLARIAWRLEKELKTTATELRTFGLEADFEDAKALNRAVNLPDAIQVGGRSATLDLYLAVCRAADDLQRWNAIHRPGRGRALGTAAPLVDRLCQLCRWTGLTTDETTDFLDKISGQCGLPVLTLATSKKRRQRTRRRPVERAT